MKMQMKMNKQQSGFTLIELVMVIVILGILAATALPKFINLGTDARGAAMKAVEGSMRSANAIIYAKAAVGNHLNGTTGTPVNVTVNNQPIATAYGFASSATELAKAMDLTPADFTIASASISHTGAPTTTTCRVTYTAATVTLLPIYATNLAGC